jgi:hypothetical protein
MVHPACQVVSLLCHVPQLQVVCNVGRQKVLVILSHRTDYLLDILFRTLDSLKVNTGTRTLHNAFEHYEVRALSRTGLHPARLLAAGNWQVELAIKRRSLENYKVLAVQQTS